MKRLFRNLALQGKLAFVISLTSSLVFLVTATAIFLFQQMSLRDDLLQEIQGLSDGITENCAAAMILKDQRAAILALEHLETIPDVVEAKLIDPKQNVFAEIYWDRGRGPEGIEYKDESQFRQEYVFLKKHLDVFDPVVGHGEALGQLMLRIDLARVNNVLIHYAWIGVVVFIIYSIVAFLLANLLQGVIIDPFNSLLLSIRTITQEQNYSHRLQKNCHGGLRIIVDGFNDLLDKIEMQDGELNSLEAHLEYLSNHDSLTNVANRFLFHNRLESSLARAKQSKSRLALLFISLSRFKNINDSLGHEVGDQVLCAVAERLNGLIRDTDTLARVGGDEFVIILEQVKRTHDVKRYVERLLREMTQIIEVSDLKLYVSVSVGVGFFPESGEDADSLMNATKIAMNLAKDKGGNSYQLYSSEMNIDVRESLLLENQLREALKNMQLLLYYQPQYELKTGLLVGFEALIRWQHPDLGLVSPLDFIPMAEENGLIVPIGEWVLNTACEQMKEIQDQWQLPLNMAVNISPRQFLHSSLVQTVAEVLYRTKLNPKFLELEITESMVMGNMDQSISKMNEFKEMGVRLAIDDFGTGYSSLEYLKKFPISKLKIDQSFVRELGHDVNDTAIVNSVIAMGKSMQLEVIAEGIETVEQLDLLGKEGCHQGQGFLFDRPLSAGEIPALLDSVLIDNPEGLTQIIQKRKVY